MADPTTTAADGAQQEEEEEDVADKEESRQRPHREVKRPRTTTTDEDDGEDKEDEQDLGTSSDDDDGDYRDASKGKNNDEDARNDDDEDDDDDDNDDDDDDDASSASEDEPHLPRGAEEWYQFLQATAQSQGVPIEYILHQMQQHIHHHGSTDDDDDDDDPDDRDDGEDNHENNNNNPPRRPTCIKDVADFIKSESCRKILILAGAGMSVISGIPDFRSADGLYNTLKVDCLTDITMEQKTKILSDPSYALDQYLFLENPYICLELQRQFILGVRSRRWKATLAHRFVELLYTKTSSSSSDTDEATTTNTKLCRLYTQNIDGLEDQCESLPRESVIPVHGSMDRAECAVCQHPMEFARFCTLVERNIKDVRQPGAIMESSEPIPCDRCGRNAVKPSIVLFRSSLPRAFFEQVPSDTADVDLLLILGTSLRVAPANTIVYRVPNRCVRVLINRDMEGTHLGLNFDDDDDEISNIGNNVINNNNNNSNNNNNTSRRRRRRTRDYFAQGEIDDVVLELASHLGWLDDLARYLPDDQLPAPSATKLRQRLVLLHQESSSSRETTTTTNGGGGGEETGATSVDTSDQ